MFCRFFIGFVRRNRRVESSKLYLGVSGYNLQEIYDLGEESLVWDVYVDKSGYYDNAAEVELSYDPTVLTDYQELTQEGLDFEVLPEHVGTLGQKRLSLAADATLGGTKLTFDIENAKHEFGEGRVENSNCEVAITYTIRPSDWDEGLWGIYSNNKYMFMMDNLGKIYAETEQTKEVRDEVSAKYEAYKKAGNPPLMDDENPQNEIVFPKD